MVLDVSLLALIDVFQFVVRCIDWVIEIHISELASQVPSLTHALDTVAAWLSPVYQFFRRTTYVAVVCLWLLPEVLLTM